MDEAKRKELIAALSGRLTRAVRLYLEGCTRCGTCIEACHAYASMPEVRYSPVGRAQNIRRIFDRYFKQSGTLAPWLNEAVELTDAWMDRVHETAYTCTGCRRCVTHCPFGIDTQQIQALAKQLLIAADLEPKVLTMLADMSIAKGENMDATKENFAKAVKNLEGEVLDRWRSEGGAAVVPLDVRGARVLYVALTGKHSIIPAAAIMNAAGEKWSLSYFEAVNFGAFVGNPQKTKDIAKRIVEEATRLGVEEVAICECGTAYRVMKHMTGEHPFEVVSFVELMERYLREGRIRVDPKKVEGKVTYHDPCQIARNGGIYEQPRAVIRALSGDFVDLEPNRAENWCCGGGGGLVAMGEKDFRMKSARVKADQMRATGAKTMITACENCHSQLSDLSAHYELGMDVRFLSDVLADALLPPAAG
jgi:Fe-S oxidoreductase